MKALIVFLGLMAGQAQIPSRDAPAAPVSGTAVISGQVVSDDEVGRPIRLAKVEITGSTLARQMMAISNEDGRFTFSNLPAGRYTISVSKPGFASVTYGAKRPGGSGVPVVVADGEQPSIVIKVPRGAVIAGTIRGADGEPASGVRLQLLKYGIDSRGARALQNWTFGNSGNGLLMTDDRGAYRIYGLAAGEYYIQGMPSGLTGRMTSSGEIDWAQRAVTATAGMQAAPPAPGQWMTMAPVLYPGTPDPAGAIPITLAAGEERTGVDFSIAFTPTASISGIVLGPDGSPPKLAQGSLIRPGAFVQSGSSLFIRPDPDGRFTISSVVPGEYVLAVRGSMQGSASSAPGPMGAAPMPLWAMADVSVSGQDISGLELRLAPGANISGRIAFDGGAATRPAEISSVSIGLSSQNATSMGTPSVTANADGTFVIPGVGPGQYKIAANVPAGAGGSSPWTLRSAMVDGVDGLDMPLSVRSDIGGVVITFTDRPTELTGTLLDANGKPAPEYYIVAFPADRAFWTPQSRRVRSVRPGNTGSFRIAGLPPGEYYLCTMTDLDQSLLNTADYLESLVGAALKLSLAEGEKKTQDLKIAGR